MVPAGINFVGNYRTSVKLKMWQRKILSACVGSLLAQKLGPVTKKTMNISNSKFCKFGFYEFLDSGVYKLY